MSTYVTSQRKCIHPTAEIEVWGADSRYGICQQCGKPMVRRRARRGTGEYWAPAPARSAVRRGGVVAELVAGVAQVSLFDGREG